MVVSSQAFAQQPTDKMNQDTLHRFNSYAQWKSDSAQAERSSPLRINNSTGRSINVMPSTLSNKKIKSNYVYDKDAQVLGGKSSVEFGKSKKKKDL